MLEVFHLTGKLNFLANIFDLTLRSNLSGGGNPPIPPFGGDTPRYVTLRSPRRGVLSNFIVNRSFSVSPLILILSSMTRLHDSA